MIARWRRSRALKLLPLIAMSSMPRSDQAAAAGRAGRKPVAESKGVNGRFDLGSDLPVGGSKCAIEFALRVIATTNKATNAAACVVNRHDCALEVRHG